MFDLVAQGSLVWLPEKGIGYYPVTSNVYDASYFEKYHQMAGAPIGKELNMARRDMVFRYCNGSLLDVGIGSGHFLESMPQAMGYDVNPAAVAWLELHGRYTDPYAGNPFDCMTFWDSLEHIKDPTVILRQVRTWALVAMPIYRDLEHLLSSKHFRKDEHFWYFTEEGIEIFFRSQGFHLVECNDAETRAGREDIKSFAFRRGTRGS